MLKSYRGWNKQPGDQAGVSPAPKSSGNAALASLGTVSAQLPIGSSEFQSVLRRMQAQEKMFALSLYLIEKGITNLADA